MENYPIFVINLINRKDRYKNVISELSKINISSNVNWFHPEKHPKGGIYGCFDSHVKVWKLFTENFDDDFCIVLEDDILISNYLINNLENINEQIKNIINLNKNVIDFIFLHNMYINYKNDNITENNFFSVGSGLLTHAYIINRKYINKIFENNNYPEPTGIHIDMELSIPNSILYTKNKLYFNNECFLQNQTIESDNINCKSDYYIRKYLTLEVFIIIMFKIMIIIKYIINGKNNFNDKYFEYLKYFTINN